jgi:S1-C subfamily serine protease
MVRYEANITSTDPEADIAVLEITLDSNQTTSSPIESLTLANSSEIRQGQPASICYRQSFYYR